MRKTDDNIILKMLEEGHTQKQIAEHFDVSPAAICKRVKRLEAYPHGIKELSPKEQRFVMSIAEGKSQTQSAIDAYEVSSVASAKALGSQLMSKPKIGAAVAEWMDYHGLDKSYRVLKLRKHVDNRDPNVSLKALDQSWRLDNSYSETVHVPINIEALIEHRISIEEASQQAQERKDAALKQIALLEANEKDSK